MASIKNMVKSILDRVAHNIDIPQSLIDKHRIYLEVEEYDLWNKDCNLKSVLTLTNSQCLAIYESSGINYLLISGLDAITSDKVEECDDNLVFNLDFINNSTIHRSAHINKDDLLEYVFTGDGTSVQDILPDTIFGCFPEIRTYKFKEAVATDDNDRLYDLKVIAYYALCQSKNSLVLPFDELTIREFINIANDSNEHYPIDYLIRSLTSSTWKTSFLDIYRCIERLYSLSFLDAYRRGLNSKLSPTQTRDVIKSIQRGKFESHEDVNIKHLIDLVPGSITSLMDGILNGETLYTWVYKRRNEIVHFQRERRPVDELTDESWNIFFQFLLKSIRSLYITLNEYLIELPDFDVKS